MRKAAMLLPVFAAMLAAACGGAGGGAGLGQVAVDTVRPPLDFTFRPPQAPMVFSVEVSGEAEFRGTSAVSSIRYRWTAKDWREEDGAWTGEVTFSDVAASMRRGSSIAMEPVEEFERLEGFSLRYRKDAAFMAMFDQLQLGMSPLNLPSPPAPIFPGQSWQDTIGTEDLREMAQALKDSLVTVTYSADEEFKGRPCAKIDYGGKLRLDGAIPAKEGSSLLKGTVEVKGQSYLDRQRGFLLMDSGRIKNIIDWRQLDAEGKSQGGEFSSAQNVDYTIGYQGP